MGGVNFNLFYCFWLRNEIEVVTVGSTLPAGQALLLNFTRGFLRVELQGLNCSFEISQVIIF